MDTLQMEMGRKQTGWRCVLAQLGWLVGKVYDSVSWAFDEYKLSLLSLYMIFLLYHIIKSINVYAMNCLLLLVLGSLRGNEEK